MTALFRAGRLRPRSGDSSTLLSGIVAIMAAMALVAAPAVAHYAGFTGEANQSTYVPTNGIACVPAGCANHSWSFVSAGGPSGSYPCGRIMNAGNHDAYGMSCGPNFVRYCSSGQAHDGGGLNCHDQDSNTYLHAGSANGGFSTTITMHGTY